MSFFIFLQTRAQRVYNANGFIDTDSSKRNLLNGWFEYGRKIIVKRETVPVNEYLQNITEEFNYYLSELGYTLHVQLAERSFEAVLDTMKFRQVVHSLLINATQHGEKGI